MSSVPENSLRGSLYAFLRILILALRGLRGDTYVRSAALSYYSLIALGPLIAIMVMVSGFIIDQNATDDFAQSVVNKVIELIAPPTLELPEEEQIASDSPAKEQLQSLIGHFIASARSGTIGVIGVLTLIFIVIQLFISIEKALNAIWGVNQGRTLVQRFFFYWGFISLAAVLGFSAASLFSATTIEHLLQQAPFGAFLSQAFLWFSPILAYLLLSSLLAAFYRFFPNTSVAWRAAFTGGLVAAGLLILNYWLSFLYVSRVIQTTSLYGSVGIVPVLMIGLYIFWLIVLLGGQLSYAVQNANFLTHQEAWNHISNKTRETLSLAAFVLIGRRFLQCQTPYTLAELTNLTRAPAQILNECLDRLQELRWVYAVALPEETGSREMCYAPAQPLESITIGDFKRSLYEHGNNEGFTLLQSVDPLVQSHYRQWLTHFDQDDKNFATLLAAFEKDNYSGLEKSGMS